MLPPNWTVIQNINTNISLDHKCYTNLPLGFTIPPSYNTCTMPTPNRDVTCLEPLPTRQTERRRRQKKQERFANSEPPRQDSLCVVFLSFFLSFFPSFLSCFSLSLNPSQVKTYQARFAGKFESSQVKKQPNHVRNVSFSTMESYHVSSEFPESNTFFVSALD